MIKAIVIKMQLSVIAAGTNSANYVDAVIASLACHSAGFFNELGTKSMMLRATALLG